MNYFVDNLSPFVWQWSPEFGIRWYGLAYAAGIVIGWWLLIRLARQGLVGLDAKSRGQFILALLLGIVVGGRLGYMILYDLPTFLKNPLTFFQFWQGGMASHGGFIGVTAACYLFAGKKKISFPLLLDVVCLMAPAGLLLGRLANFINGELWGKISHVPWAVIFPKSAEEGTPLNLIAPRHPSQLYEAALEGLFLLIYTQLRYRQTRLKKPGQLAAEFIFLYCLARIFCEQFREPDASLFFGLSRGVFYSALLIPLSLFVWLRVSGKRPNSK
jgi:phosphatidylglycerol:prolipoprotein diacylglycerol transferase